MAKKIGISQLSKEMKKIAKKSTTDEIGLIISKLAMDGFRRLVEYSATDTGFLRSNWMMTKGVAPENVRHHPGGEDYSDAAHMVKKYDYKAVVTIYNNTAYAMYLETGTSRMRSQPMIQPTYQFLTNEASRAASALSKRRVK